MLADGRIGPLGALALVVLALGACGGGGQFGIGHPAAGTVTVTGVSSPIWHALSGGPAPGAPCPDGVPLNADIEFLFLGEVDATSLPGWQGWVPGTPEPGPTLAQGTINITTSNGSTTTPATGTFRVVDDPSLPPGNRRRVRFSPVLPGDPNAPLAMSDLAGGSRYDVVVPARASGGPVLRVGGADLVNEIVTCFATCDPATAPGTGCFADPVPGPPHVVMTTPMTSDPAPPAIDPAAVPNDTLGIFFDEPLFPQDIDSGSIRLVDPSSGAQVPGSVTFFQAGTPEAGPDGARIDYVASSPLLSGTTYELLIDGSRIRDFGDNAAALYAPGDPNAGGRRLFRTIVLPFCQATPITEDFTSTANRESTSGVAVWDGSGALTSEYPLELFGDGSFGMLTTPTGSITLDTDMPGITGFADGVWNTTGVNIPAGSLVRVIGTDHQAHLRSSGQVRIAGSLDGNAPDSFASDIRPVPVGDPEQGAFWGRIRQGFNPTFAVVDGGVGGVGGGRGGNASQAGYTTRTQTAEDGFGAAFDGQPNPGPFGANPHYGGGDGGDGGPRTITTANPNGERGGLGGAGGSAFTRGEEGRPRTQQTQGCTPLPTSQPISMPTAIPAAFMAPITTQSAGSGGGGGGDAHEATQSPPNDHQGGGGGGGGGGLRISALQEVFIEAGATISMDGGKGGGGSFLFSGHGGGGSGGQIWLQSYDRLDVSSLARMTADAGEAGDRGTPCGEFDAGAGGLGLIQLEDSQPALINTNFVRANPTNIQTVAFPFSTAIRGEARSTWFDTGYGAPDYDAPVEFVNPGTAPGARARITYEGAFESVSGGRPDPATISQPVTGTNIGQLDGYRFIRFRVVIEFDPPLPGGGGTTLNDTLPEVGEIRIRYQTPLACP